MKKLLLLLILSFLSTSGFSVSCPDGSEPTKTVSADGSYYLYKCDLGYPDGELREPLDQSYFSAKAEYFRKLVDNDMYFSAQKLFKKYQRSYFLKKPPFLRNRPYDDLIKEFKIASDGIRATFEPSIEEHIDAMNIAIKDINNTETSLEANWEYYKSLLINTQKLSSHYSKTKNPIVSWTEKSIPLKLKLKATENNLSNSLKNRATKVFKSYDIVNKPGFFSVYPVSLSAREKVKLITSSSSYIISTLESISPEKASDVIKKYELDTLKTPIKIKLLANQFESYDVLNMNNFFTGYSLTSSDEIDVINSVSKYLLTQLDKSSLEQAIKIIKLYNLNRSEIDIQAKLPQVILQKAIDNKQPATKDILAIINNMTAIQVNTKSLLPDKYQISVFKITSKYEKEPVISTSNLLNKPSNNIQDFAKSPYIITIQSRISSVDMGDDNLKKIQSQYKSSTSLVQNSKYTRLQSSYQRASNEYDAAMQELNQLRQWVTNVENEARDFANSYQGGSSFTCNTTYQGYSSTSNCSESGNSYYAATYNSYIGNSFWGLEAKVNNLKNKINRAKNSRDSYRSQLASTPSQISKDNFKNYSFTTRTFEVTKNIERSIYLINNNSKTYSGFTFKHPEKKTFVYASGLDRNDKKYAQNRYQTDDDVEIFINKPDSFSLDKLLTLIPSNHSNDKLDAPIQQVLRETELAFEELTKKNITQNEQNQNISEPAQTESGETVDYIEKIKEAKSLLDAGIISEEEFEKIKQKIIDNI